MEDLQPEEMRHRQAGHGMSFWWNAWLQVHYVRTLYKNHTDRSQYTAAKSLVRGCEMHRNQHLGQGNIVVRRVLGLNVGQVKGVALQK